MIILQFVEGIKGKSLWLTLEIPGASQLQYMYGICNLDSERASGKSESYSISLLSSCSMVILYRRGSWVFLKISPNQLHLAFITNWLGITNLIVGTCVKLFN